MAIHQTNQRKPGRIGYPKQGSTFSRKTPGLPKAVDTSCRWSPSLLSHSPNPTPGAKADLPFGNNSGQCYIWHYNNQRPPAMDRYKATCRGSAMPIGTGLDLQPGGNFSMQVITGIDTAILMLLSCSSKQSVTSRRKHNSRPMKRQHSSTNNGCRRAITKASKAFSGI